MIDESMNDVLHREMPVGVPITVPESRLLIKGRPFLDALSQAFTCSQVVKDRFP